MTFVNLHYNIPNNNRFKTTKFAYVMKHEITIARKGSRSTYTNSVGLINELIHVKDYSEN